MPERGKPLRFGLEIDRTAGYKMWRRSMQKDDRPTIRAVDIDDVLWREDEWGRSHPIAVVELTVFDKAYPMYGAHAQTLERVQANAIHIDSMLSFARANGVKAWLVAYHIGDSREDPADPLELARRPPIAFWIYDLTGGLGWYPKDGLDVGYSPAAFYRWLEELPLAVTVAP